ncbi:MAG: acyl-CoA thioesterase [Planctomycetes bacterium]|nr:acyl-CoA thioesterase [Planctomycetota bacterium]
MPGEFRMTRRVQFVETDLAGVLHFSNYYRWMEEAECGFWRSLGLKVVNPHEGGHMSWPRAATSCEYFAPARFEDELELTLTVAAVGERSVTFEVEFRRDGERIARGRSTGVCCIMSDGAFRSTRIPDDIRSKLT